MSTVKFLALIEIEVPFDVNPGSLSMTLQEELAKWGTSFFQGGDGKKWKAALMRLQGMSFMEYETQQSKLGKVRLKMRELRDLVDEIDR